MSAEFQLGKNGWEDVREPIDSFRALQQSLYSRRYPNEYDYASKVYEAQTPDPYEPLVPALTASETIALARNVVEAARREQESLNGDENVGEAVKLSLTVDMGRKGIESLPEEVVYIWKRNVERLVLCHNQISHLPPKFSECTALTYLNLRGNRFREVPRAIHKLPKLQILDLSRNRLARLPEEMKSLKALRVLSVMNNNLESVPFSLGFLESLRILKLAGNPLGEDLKAILDGNDGSPSPLIVPLAESEKEARLTIKIKQYLKNEAAALESGGESSSESPLDTPRPLKRNTSLRFPVVPATSGSESAPDLRSPGFNKPAIPARSHYRVASGQNTQLQNAALRRPGVTPLLINGNERNRSNSESILQATQTNKIKRMGIITRKTSELGTVDEMRTNRNSYHNRGYSHASVLREKHNSGGRKGSGSSSSTPISPIEIERQRGFVRRLSSLPEHKRDPRPVNNLIECYRGVLYSLYQVHSQIGPLLHVIKEGTTKRSSLERRYFDATTQLEQLDKELYSYGSDRRGSFPLKGVRAACRESITAYHRVSIMLWHSIPHLVNNTDPRYLRTLILCIFGGMAEARIAFNGHRMTALSRTLSETEPPPVPALPQQIPKPEARPNILLKERPQTVRRLPSEAAINGTRYAGVVKSSTNPYAAVPLYVNGRSRSNSRTTNLTSSAASSVVNTPRIVDTFLIPGTPVISGSETSLPSTSFLDTEQDAVFEKIYLGMNECLEQGLAGLPVVSSILRHRLDLARSTYLGEDVVTLWAHLVKRCRHCHEMCEEAKKKYSMMTLNEQEVKNSKEFWTYFSNFGHSFHMLVMLVMQAKKLNIIDSDVQRLLQPIYRCMKDVFGKIGKSPWAWILDQPSPLQPAVSNAQWHGQSLANGGANGRYYPHTNGFPNGHHRTRGDSGSSSSPYVASGPATPMSAALGPAAVATMPSTPASAALDRTFQGGVFERADALLNLQHTMLYRR